MRFPICALVFALIAFAACGAEDTNDNLPTATPTGLAAATSAATQTLQPTADASPTTATTPPPADSVEFVNAEFGYRLRYPGAYTDAGQLQIGLNILDQHAFSTDGSSSRSNLAAGEAIVIVRVADNPEGKTLDAWAAGGGTETLAARVLSTTEVSMAGQRAIQITAGPGMEGPRVTHVMTYVARDDRVYLIWLFPGSPEAATAHRAEYDLMVSTFEFIE